MPREIATEFGLATCPVVCPRCSRRTCQLPCPQWQGPVESQQSQPQLSRLPQLLSRLRFLALWFQLARLCVSALITPYLWLKDRGLEEHLLVRTLSWLESKMHLKSLRRPPFKHLVSSSRGTWHESLFRSELAPTLAMVWCPVGITGDSITTVII